MDLEGDHWDGAGLDVETRNGGVRMTVPATYSAEVRILLDVQAAEGEALEVTATAEGGGADSVTKTLTTQVSATPAQFGFAPRYFGLFRNHRQ